MPLPTSTIPDFYYFIFVFCEPALSIVGSLFTLYNPKATHNAQAPWPAGTSPPTVLPTATIVTVTQLAHVCALVGVLNIAVLTAARKHLASHLALQEKIIGSFLLPLLAGDVFYIYITSWELGEDRWNVARWSPLIMLTFVSEVALVVIRVMWYLGVGRYVDARDRAPAHAESDQASSQLGKH